MSNDLKEFMILWILGIGHTFLWGSIGIGFLDWSYDMAFFRTSIMGLVLIAVGHYMQSKLESK